MFDTYEETVPSPVRKKQAASILKDDLDGSTMSSGVFATSAAKRPNPIEKRAEAIKEHAQGPYSSITLPTSAANGYWPVIPLEQFIRMSCSGKLRVLQKCNGS
jgi:tRNA (Thr-GGU) A37 N-methylase